MTEENHINLSSVKLIKNTKGYQWEIKIYDKEGIEMVEEIQKIDLQLKLKYSPEVIE